MELFDLFRSFLIDYEKIVGFVEFVIFLVLAVLLYRKTGNIKYLSEVFDMKYRTGNYQDKKGYETPKQSFNNLKPVYRLNEVTNELEKTGEFIDIDEVVNSCKDMAINAILERFLPPQDGTITDYTNMKGDLDFLTESLNMVEDYKAKYNLPSETTPEEVFAFIDKEAKTLKAKIDESQKLAEKIKNGGLDNEKKTNEESK